MRRGGWTRTVQLCMTAIVGMAALSGCVQDPTDTQLLGVQDAVDFDDSAALWLEGVAVDDEYRPLAGVAIVLSPGDRSVDSDDAGNFRLAVPEPGAYILSAYKLFYADATHDVVVASQSVTGIELVLASSAAGIPYHETETYVSYAFCHGPIGGGCFAANTVLGANYLPEDRPDFGYEIPADGFRQLLFEAQWEGQNAGTGRFIARNPDGLFLGCNNTDGQAANPVSAAGGKSYAPTKRYYSSAGGEFVASPVRFWVDAGRTNAETGACHDMPYNQGDKIWQTVRIVPDGSIPGMDVVACCALDVRAEVFLTFFYWSPSDDPSFTALAD